MTDANESPSVTKKTFTVHFDYYRRDTDEFIKRTTLPYVDDSWESCYFSVTKVCALLLANHRNEPWKIRIAVEGHLDTVVTMTTQ